MTKVSTDKPIIISVSGQNNLSIPENDQKKRKLTFTQNKQLIFQRDKKKEGANFYDLGQINTGSKHSPIWSDLPFVVNPTLTVSADRPEPIFFGISGWNALKAKILEVPLGDFDWKYKKLEYEEAEQYYIDLYTGDPSTPIYAWEREDIYSVGRENSRYNPLELVNGEKWTEKGLQFPATRNFSFAPSLLFADIFGVNKKITSQNIYASTPVSDFELAKDASIFLVPQPYLLYGTDGTQIVLSDLTGMFGWIFTTLPRTLILNNNTLRELVINQLGPPIASAAVRTDWAYDVNTDPALRISIRNKARSTPNVQYYRRGGAGFVDPQTFPINPKNTVAWTTYGFNNYPFDIDLAVRLEEGALLAIIHQDKNWYYVWSSSLSSSTKQIRFAATSNSGDGGLGDDSNAPKPTPVLNAYLEETGHAPTPGSGIPTVVHRRVRINIIGGYVSGPWLPQSRQIQLLRDGVIYSDTTAGFDGLGWGLGSYASDWDWDFNRIFRSGHTDSTSEVYENGNQEIKVRDKFVNGAFQLWSTWGSFTATWPRDFARDGGTDQAYLEAYGYYQDES